MAVEGTAAGALLAGVLLAAMRNSGALALSGVEWAGPLDSGAAGADDVPAAAAAAATRAAKLNGALGAGREAGVMAGAAHVLIDADGRDMGGNELR